MTGPSDLYRYRATLIPWDKTTKAGTAWHDGDTCRVDVDLGCHAHWQGHLRAAGYNAPEVYGDEKPKGEEAATYVRSLADTGDTVYLDSLAFEHGGEEDDFGRMLGAVTLADGRDLCSLMIDSGHAVADPA